MYFALRRPGAKLQEQNRKGSTEYKNNLKKFRKKH